ncbi:hypothetical protein GBA52_010967 [Prunus armeniaca]|nr:hypothetical protein GBA52_010967 [Prunus armeniaca]
MTTGRINQVAFLSDVGSVQDKRPCGSSARRGHDSRYVSSENASNWTIGGPKTPRAAQCSASEITSRNLWTFTISRVVVG